MTVASPEVLREVLIDRVYRLATQLDGITEIAALIGRETQSRSCALMLQHRTEYSTHGGWCWGIDHVWAAAYVERFFACDPTVAEHFRISPEQAYATELNCQNEAFRQSEFYRDFCEPQRLGYFAGAYSILSDSLALRLTVQGDVDRGQYSPRDLALMQGLLPHLRRAVEISRDVSHVISHAAAFSAVLEKSRSALILLDLGGQLIHANDAARAMAGDGYRILGQTLMLRDRDAQAQLSAAIATCAGALRGSAANIMQAGCHVSIPRAGELPLSAYLAPIRLQRSNDWDPLPQDVVTLQILDPQEERSVDARTLQTVIGLTAAEARVAASLCRGASAREIATQYDISAHTVRDHIKHIYRRLDISKQSEFVARAYSVLRMRGPA